MQRGTHERRRRGGRIAILAAIALLGGALVGLARGPIVDPAPILTRQVVAAASPRPEGPLTTVVLIVFENHDWATIKGSPSAPYLNRLLTRPDAVFASNAHNVPTTMTLHPSEPNYLWLEAGTNRFPDHVFTTDEAPSATNVTTSPWHLMTLLQQRGVPWTVYAEGISGTSCPIGNAGAYVAKHNPVVFFQDVAGNPPRPQNAVCQQHVRPASELAPRLAQDAVRGYNLLIPDLCHDMHSNVCPGARDPIAQGDAWLAANLPALLAAPVYQRGDALIAITWDEGTRGNQPIGLILLSPQTKGNGDTNAIEYSHASWVKTVEEIFGLSPLLGHAADSTTRDLGDFFPAGVPRSPAATPSAP
jgi:hypothetical protein